MSEMPDENNALNRLRASMTEKELGVVAVMEKVRGEYLPSGWDEDLRRAFDGLLRTVATRHDDQIDDEASERRRETRALVVVGEAGTGKTESLSRLFRTHPVLQGYGVLGSGCPLVTVSVPSPCTLKTLGIRLLRALGYPLARDMREHLVWNLVFEHLELSGTLVLHLDEMHNLTDGANVAEIDTIQKTLKALMVSPEWPVGLVVSGLPSIVPDLRAVEEIRRRGRFVRVPLLDIPGDLSSVAQVITHLAGIAGVTVEKDFAENTAPRLAHAGIHRFGIAVELVHEAIEIAIADGVPLDLDTFATAYFDRTGVGDLLNPFVAVSWAEIDCSLILLDEAPPEQVLPADPRKRDRPKSRKNKGKHEKGGR
ncbi:ATP-binding protein [Methylobacterium persicinum]|jgi:hypothetical protein|uniref:ORC1/DEAH AAA+ ATPase domain-containing protein n=1 Tax=Methylobacterium persicinum TaxID=374426 RepID=A0ABU0HHP8_9HYPH|nr:ATP-binding protein [Methylobacterium persicinum]MDQ0441841.1 hypothetical protein [Methylobacterium persicinum]GJE38024.1 hypothetical protein KHHGKMAE_2090 [Methylobacterium persicinum]